MAKEICNECQCRTCWLRIPDGGPNDCHHCDFCLEIASDIQINCGNYKPINNYGGTK